MLLKLSLVLGPFVFGGQTKLGWYHDQVIFCFFTWWKWLALISSLWVIDSQEILKGLSNKRSGSLTVMFKHNVHDKQVLYLSRMTQKYSGLLLPGKLTTAELGHWTSIHRYGKNIPRKCENFFVGMKKLYFMFLLNQFIHTFEVTNVCLNKSIVHQLPSSNKVQKKRTSLCMSKMIQSKSRTKLYSASLDKEKDDVAGKHS